MRTPRGLGEMLGRVPHADDAVELADRSQLVLQLLMGQEGTRSGAAGVIRWLFAHPDAEDEVRRILYDAARRDVAFRNALADFASTTFESWEPDDDAGSIGEVVTRTIVAANAASSAHNLDDRLDAVMELKRALSELVDVAHARGARDLQHAATMIKWAVGLEHAEDMSESQLQATADCAELLEGRPVDLDELADVLRSHDLDYVPEVES